MDIKKLAIQQKSTVQSIDIRVSNKGTPEECYFVPLHAYVGDAYAATIRGFQRIPNNQLLHIRRSRRGVEVINKITPAELKLYRLPTRVNPANWLAVFFVAK